MILRIQVIENAVFAFKQPPTLIRHIAVTCVVVALTVLASLLTDCVGIVLELNVRHAASSLLTSSSHFFFMHSFLAVYFTDTGGFRQLAKRAIGPPVLVKVH